MKCILNDPARSDYSELAPAHSHNELAAAVLFHETRGGKEAVAKEQRRGTDCVGRTAHEAAAA